MFDVDKSDMLFFAWENPRVVLGAILWETYRCIMLWLKCDSFLVIWNPWIQDCLVFDRDAWKSFFSCVEFMLPISMLQISQTPFEHMHGQYSFFSLFQFDDCGDFVGLKMVFKMPQWSCLKHPSVLFRNSCLKQRVCPRLPWDSVLLAHDLFLID